MQHSKICTNCGGDPQPLSEYYERTPGKHENICKACIRARTIERHNLLKAGLYVNKTKIVVVELCGTLKTCTRCKSEKDLNHFRKYRKKVNGKSYEYHDSKCRGCEADIAQEKRDKANLFDEKHFSDITDYYNSDGKMILHKDYLL